MSSSRDSYGFGNSDSDDDYSDSQARKGSKYNPHRRSNKRKAETSPALYRMAKNPRLDLETPGQKSRNPRTLNDSTSSRTKLKTPRKPREPRPRLMKWTDDDWKKCVLSIVWACGEEGVNIPFEKVARMVNQHCSASALQQALLKLRNKMIEEDKEVPPPAKMSWTKPKPSASITTLTPAPAQPRNCPDHGLFRATAPSNTHFMGGRATLHEEQHRRHHARDAGDQSHIVRLRLPRNVWQYPLAKEQADATDRRTHPGDFQPPTRLRQEAGYVPHEEEWQDMNDNVTFLNTGNIKEEIVDNGTTTVGHNHAEWEVSNAEALTVEPPSYLAEQGFLDEHEDIHESHDTSAEALFEPTGPLELPFVDVSSEVNRTVTQSDLPSSQQNGVKTEWDTDPTEEFLSSLSARINQHTQSHDKGYISLSDPTSPDTTPSRSRSSPTERVPGITGLQNEGQPLPATSTYAVCPISMDSQTAPLIHHLGGKTQALNSQSPYQRSGSNMLGSRYAGYEDFTGNGSPGGFADYGHTAGGVPNPKVAYCGFDGHGDSNVNSRSTSRTMTPSPYTQSTLAGPQSGNVSQTASQTAPALYSQPSIGAAQSGNCGTGAQTGNYGVVPSIGAAQSRSFDGAQRGNYGGVQSGALRQRSSQTSPAVYVQPSVDATQGGNLSQTTTQTGPASYPQPSIGAAQSGNYGGVQSGEFIQKSSQTSLALYTQPSTGAAQDGNLSRTTTQTGPALYPQPSIGVARSGNYGGAQSGNYGDVQNGNYDGAQSGNYGVPSSPSFNFSSDHIPFNLDSSLLAFPIQELNDPNAPLHPTLSDAAINANNNAAANNADRIHYPVTAAPSDYYDQSQPLSDPALLPNNNAVTNNTDRINYPLNSAPAEYYDQSQPFSSDPALLPNNNTPANNTEYIPYPFDALLGEYFDEHQPLNPGPTFNPNGNNQNENLTGFAEPLWNVWGDEEY